MWSNSREKCANSLRTGWMFTAIVLVYVRVETPREAVVRSDPEFRIGRETLDFLIYEEHLDR